MSRGVVQSLEMEAKSLAPKQARSRESLRKLLKAAAEVLGQHGVDGATIPRIAAHAGMTPGAVYRRFRDKEALLEAVILRILERQTERLEVSGLTVASAGRVPLAVLTEQLIGSMVVSYRSSAPLLRAMRQFSQTRANTPFWRKATRLEVAAFERIVDLFLAHKAEIGHPDPKTAVPVALMMVIGTLFEVIVVSIQPGPLDKFLPEDAGLKRELTRAFLNYLGAPSSEMRTHHRG
jgi:AcrR family transcriptional regulator